MGQSTTTDIVSLQPLTRFCYNFFYLKTWYCSVANTYYNLTSGMCEDCSIPGCNSCANLYLCDVCDGGLGLYLNATAPIQSQCVPCAIPNCLQCNTATDCLICDASTNYFYNANTTGITDNCVLCSIPFCVTSVSYTHLDVYKRQQ